ncbi:NAD(P)H-dependent oxidoreductase subunit E [Candidatus Vondammii sp. HM_W22]|uniref:NAD(P)H-dependent oxidoreductase subunit E n=1 Tax=Candidatus Vondammii sp. HM_W22 TaxID=2687299 RepID=UPI002E7ADC42|nr:NAD(P)H-dependent oxidoreductase subunit E [Candidatus Vondammii sp. HM_W22]
MPDMDTRKAATELLKQWNENPHNLLQILIGLQQTFQHIPATAIELLAEKLSLSYATIKGIISFYSFLHLEPRGSYDILFSDNVIDQMQGSRALATRLSERLGSTGLDGQISIDFTSCTGMGDQGPACLVNGHTIASLTPARIEQIALLIKKELPLEHWPQELFSIKGNIQRKDIQLSGSLTPGDAIGATLKQGPENTLKKIEAAGLRGRGGAGFSTATKWRFCREADAKERVVVCNADEGEPGTFKDRLLLQFYPDRLFEGMTLCAAVIGAGKGFLYLRGEYLYLHEPLQKELERRRAEGLLGKAILGDSDFNFDIEIHLGAGAYICGEESALIESLEGKRGIPRIRPPFPVTSGYLGYPTVVNNVETLVAAAMIVDKGADWFRSRGTESSTGTKLLSISGDCEQPGIYEYPFGVTIERVLADCGATEVQAVQVSGPAGELVPPSEFQRRIAFEDLATVGTTLLVKRLEKVSNSHATCKDLDNMETIGTLMRETSHCGLGQTAANPILESMAKFPDLYRARLRSTSFEPAFDVDASLEEARKITGRDDPGAHLKRGGV